MATEKDKRERINKLKKEIEEIRNEPSNSYVLIQVTPDGNGVKDMELNLVVSTNQVSLINYCEDEFNYSPSLTDKRSDDDKDWFRTWYRISDSDIKIL